MRAVEEQLDKASLQHFVATHPQFKWCPGPNCAMAYNLTDAVDSETASPAVMCSSCSQEFCFGCGQEDIHRPAPCTMHGMWQQLVGGADDNAFQMWMQANTQACPKCKKPIEKNDGCNSMHCKPPGGCGHEFCWICLGTHSSMHSFGQQASACNQYKDKAVQASVDARSNAKALEKAKNDRFQHYAKRYTNHEDSHKKEVDPTKGVLLKAIERRKGILHAAEFTTVRLSFPAPDPPVPTPALLPGRRPLARTW